MASHVPVVVSRLKSSFLVKTQLFFFLRTYLFFCCDSWTHSWAKYYSVHTVKSNLVACLHSKAFPFWFLCKIVLKQEKNLLRIDFSAFWRRNIWIFLSRTLHAYNSKCRWDFQPHWFQTIEKRRGCQVAVRSIIECWISILHDDDNNEMQIAEINLLWSIVVFSIIGPLCNSDTSKRVSKALLEKSILGSAAIIHYRWWLIWPRKHISSSTK